MIAGPKPVAFAYAVGPLRAEPGPPITVLEDLKAQREGLLGIGFWHCWCTVSERPFRHPQQDSAGSLDDCLHHTQPSSRKFSAASSSGQREDESSPVIGHAHAVSTAWCDDQAIEPIFAVAPMTMRRKFPELVEYDVGNRPGARTILLRMTKRACPKRYTSNAQNRSPAVPRPALQVFQDGHRWARSGSQWDQQRMQNGDGRSAQQSYAILPQQLPPGGQIISNKTAARTRAIGLAH